MAITPEQFELAWTTQGWDAAIRLAEAGGGVLPVDPSSGQFSTLTSPKIPLTPMDFSETFRNPSGDDGEAFYNDGLSDPILISDPFLLNLVAEGESVVGSGAGVGQMGLGGPIAVAGGLVAARAALRALMGTASRVTAPVWNRLPGWAQTALVAVGITVGSELALDLGGIDDTGIIPGFGFPDGGGTLGMVMGIQVVGSWHANGVTFYRLATGQLAVQNKHGKWKLWRPKKPIVLYASGAGDLSTYLRADKALDKQAKRLRKSLDRRAPRRKSSTPAHGHPDGTTITNVKA